MSTPVPPRPDREMLGPPPPPSRPAATWRWWEAVIVYVLASLVSLTISAPLVGLIHPSGVAEVVVSAVVAIVNVAILLLWLSRFHHGWERVIGFPSRIWREAPVAALFGVGLYAAIVFGIGPVLDQLFRLVSGHAVRTPDQLPSHMPAAGIVASVVYGIAIAPIHEELFFRGMLFRSLRDRYGFRVGALGSAFGFGLIHYIPAPLVDSALLMLIMVFTGFALAYWYERRGNIVASMFAHAAFNVIGLLLIFALR